MPVLCWLSTEPARVSRRPYRTQQCLAAHVGDVRCPLSVATLMLSWAVAFLTFLTRRRDNSFNSHVRDHVAIVFVVMRGVP